MKEIQNLLEDNFNLRAQNTEYAPYKGKLKKLESQNSILKEKTNDIRRENDSLVDKIQKLQVSRKLRENILYKISVQKRLSSEQAVRVSVTEYEDDAFMDRQERLPEIDTPTSIARDTNRMSPSFSEEYFKLEERRFHEAAVKVRI